MEELNLDNILDDNDLSLFNEVNVPQSSDDDTEEKEVNETKTKATEVDTDSMFGVPESVGSDEDEDEEDKVEDTPDESSGSSPRNPSFFSSIAEAFMEEGILPNLDEDSIKQIKSAKDLRSAIDEYIQSELTEQQRRIATALGDGVPPDIIKQHEAVIAYLDRIDEDYLRDEENEEVAKERQRLIYQDYVNRGFSQERAVKEVEKAMKNGTEIQDAIDALQSNRDFMRTRYNALLQHARQKAQYEQSVRDKQVQDIVSKVTDSKYKFFDTISPDKKTRLKIIESVSKPVERDEDGRTYTAVQKYSREHPDEFNVLLGFFYTMTDGFKNIDKLISQEVHKKVKKGFSELETKLNNTSRDIYGNLNYAGNYDENAYIGKGIKLNI